MKCRSILKQSNSLMKGEDWLNNIWSGISIKTYFSWLLSEIYKLMPSTPRNNSRNHRSQVYASNQSRDQRQSSMQEYVQRRRILNHIIYHIITISGHKTLWHQWWWHIKTNVRWWVTLNSKQGYINNNVIMWWIIFSSLRIMLVILFKIETMYHNT